MLTTASLTGLILHLQRLSTEDGPGLRTTVFFKGCPLHCQWCHNPESISPRPEVQWIKNRCIGCDSCIEICDHHGLVHTADGIQRDRSVCSVCGACVEACPANAMELLGIEISVENLVAELKKDQSFFKKSGGGVTLSGGEPTLQPHFAVELVTQLKAAHLNVALDTCLLTQRQTLEALYPQIDLFLVDLKLIDPLQHERWTGAPLAPILNNLIWLADQLRQQDNPKRLWIRTPLIPGATATLENLGGISRYLADHLSDVVERWELCAFNNLCQDKYSRLDLNWHFADTALMSQSDLSQAGIWARSGGFDPQRTFVTGAARFEENETQENYGTHTLPQ